MPLVCNPFYSDWLKGRIPKTFNQRARFKNRTHPFFTGRKIVVFTTSPRKIPFIVSHQAMNSFLKYSKFCIF